MKDGQVSESGTYKELLDKRGNFADFLLLHMQEESENEIDEIGNINGALNFDKQVHKGVSKLKLS